MDEQKATNLVCPHCGVLSRHECVGYVESEPVLILLEDQQGQEEPFGVRQRHYVFRCPSCKRDTYLLGEDPIRQVDATGARTRKFDKPGKVLFQWPTATSTAHKAVPGQVKSASLEAQKCLVVGARNACATMARRAVEAICRDKGAKGDSLFDRLAHLRETQQITPDLCDWAQDLRIVGKWGAHPEWEDVSEEEARHAVDFLQEIIKYVYVLPAERQAKRLKETKKKKPQ